MIDRDKPVDADWPSEPANIVTVPKHLTEKVVEYLNQLMSDGADTSGFMIRGISTSVAGAGPLNAKWSGTICGRWQTGTLGEDSGCADTD